MTPVECLDAQTKPAQSPDKREKRSLDFRKKLKKKNQNRERTGENGSRPEPFSQAGTGRKHLLASRSRWQLVTGSLAGRNISRSGLAGEDRLRSTERHTRQQYMTAQGERGGDRVGLGWCVGGIRDTINIAMRHVTEYPESRSADHVKERSRHAALTSSSLEPSDDC